MRGGRRGGLGRCLLLADTKFTARTCDAVRPVVYIVGTTFSCNLETNRDT